MRKINRENYVARTYFYFLVFANLSGFFIFIGAVYIFLNRAYVDMADAFLVYAGVTIALLCITYVCWRTYLGDKKLLESKDAYMTVRTRNLDARGVAAPDCHGEDGG